MISNNKQPDVSTIPLNDIPTPRLTLRLMDKDIISACLAGDISCVESLLGAVVMVGLIRFHSQTLNI